MVILTPIMYSGFTIYDYDIVDGWENIFWVYFYCLHVYHPDLLPGKLYRALIIW